MKNTSVFFCVLFFCFLFDETLKRTEKWPIMSNKFLFAYMYCMVNCSNVKRLSRTCEIVSFCVHTNMEM